MRAELFYGYNDIKSEGSLLFLSTFSNFYLPASSHLFVAPMRPQVPEVWHSSAILTLDSLILAYRNNQKKTQKWKPEKKTQPKNKTICWKNDELQKGQF